jgi:hypothetical protein
LTASSFEIIDRVFNGAIRRFEGARDRYGRPAGPAQEGSSFIVAVVLGTHYVYLSGHLA